MLCNLREFVRINVDTISSIEKYFAENSKPHRNNNVAPHTLKDETSSTFLTSTDEAFLSEDDSVNGDDSAEKDTGLRNFSAVSSERSDAEAVLSEASRWLKSCLISGSTNLDLLVLAHVQKFIILQQSLTFSSKLEPTSWVQVEEPSGSSQPYYITAVHTLCIASTRSSEASSFDWTCICVGLSNGYLHFYTERGILVFREHCSNSSIVAIRFGPSICPGNQELVVLTAENKLVIFEGLSLFETLKTARNQIAHEKTVAEISDLLQINCHCLELDSLKHVKEVQPSGTIKPTSFDQYVTASRSGAGKYAKITRTSLPTYNNYFCCTSSHHKFGSFLWHDAGVSHSTIITDAFYNLTSQITNQMPSFGIRSWLGVGTSRKDRPPKSSAVDARANKIPVRTAIDEKGRIGERCYTAPAGWPLIAVADSCARVLLINTHLRQIVRIWKGYRNARCAWIESSSSSNLNQNRRYCKTIAKTLFLVIFAPKRGLLEVWSMENGPRVSAFKVDSRGRLLSLPSAIDGTLIGSSNAKFASSFACNTATFISSCGRIFTINAPFHLSALDASVSSVHDENLLKQFHINNVLTSQGKTQLNGSVLDVKKWLILFNRLKTSSAKRRFVEMLLNCSASYQSAKMCDSSQTIPDNEILEAVEELIQCLSMDADSAQGESSSKPKISFTTSSFLHFLATLKIVLQTYIRLQSLDRSRTNLLEEQQNQVQGTSVSEVDYKELKKCLRLTDEDLVEFNLELLSCCTQSSTENIRKRISGMRMDLKEFKEQFEFTTGLFSTMSSVISRHQSVKDDNESSLTAPIKSTEINNLGLAATLFGPFLSGKVDVNILFNEILPKIDVPTSTLIEIFVDFWLAYEWNCSPQLFALNSFSILKGLLLGKSQTDERHFMSIIHSAIEVIEKKVFSSQNVHAALILCLQMRSLQILFSSQNELQVKRIRLDSQQQQPKQSENSNEQLKPSEINQQTEEQSSSDDDEQESNKQDDDQFLVFEEEDITATDVDNVWWTLLLKHLTSLSLLQCLPTNTYDDPIAGSSVRQADKQLSLEKLSQRGYGFYREQLGVWVSQLQPNARELAYVLSGKELPEEQRDTASCLSETTKSVLRSLCAIFPSSLRPELILCDCTWECASAWYKDESRRVTKLQLTIDLLELLQPSARLQHGIALMIWNTFLKTPFERLLTLLDANENKVLNNKDRVLRRDVLVVETDLIDFIECLRNLLDILGNSSTRLESDPVHRHLYEPHIEKFFQRSTIAQKENHNRTLSQLANRHKAVNYHLVLHHIHLITAIQLQISLSISIRLKGLFDAVGRRAFFEPLHSHPLIPLANVDDRTKGRRQKFLEHVVECIGAHTAINTAQLPTQDRLYHKHWNLAMQLARDWNLDVNTLHTREIILLYQWGFDQEAEKLLPKVQSHKLLALSILPLIAGRIKWLLEEEPKLQLRVFQCSAASESTIVHVKQLSEELAPKFDEVKPSMIRAMIRNVGNLLTKASKTESSSSSSSSNFSLMDIGAKFKMLKEFDEICAVADKSINKK